MKTIRKKTPGCLKRRRFAPTMGIIGTVMGLISVLETLQTPTNSVLPWQWAFVATLWGLGSANLFWLPVGAKIKLKTKLEVVQKEVIVEGVMSIQAGENHGPLRKNWKSF